MIMLHSGKIFEYQMSERGSPMSVPRAQCLVVALISLLTAGKLAADQPVNASGTVTVNGKATALHHAYARHDASLGGTLVLITDRALEAPMLAEETAGFSSGATPSLTDLTKKGEVNGVELLINDSNHVEMAEVYSSAFDMPTPFSGKHFWYEPYRLDSGWTGGRSRTHEPETFFKRTFAYDVTFLTTIGSKGFEIVNAAQLAAQHKAIDAHEALRLIPVGGGDEGKAYLAYRRDLDAHNGAALLKQMTAAMKSRVANEMHTPEPLDESTAGSWAFMAAVRPGKVEVVGGVHDPDSTRLELMKTEAADGTKSFGTARMTREKGDWKVDDETWR